MEHNFEEFLKRYEKLTKREALYKMFKDNCNLQQKIDKALELAEDLEAQIELTYQDFNKDKTYANAYEQIKNVEYHYNDIQEIVLFLKGEKKKMLKIRDNVDLEELKKYGFELDYFKNYEKKLKSDKRLSLEVSKDDRLIFFEDENCNKNNDLDTLYDLINDGLIEKVER